MAGLVDDDVLDTLTIIATPDTVAGEVRATLRRPRRPHHRVVVAQGLVAARGRPAAGAVTRRARVRRAGLRARRRGAGERRAVHRRATANGSPISAPAAARSRRSSTASASSTSGPGDAAPGRRVGRGTRPRSDVGDEGAHRAVRARARRPRRARRRRARRRRTGPSSARPGKGATTRPPRAEPPVGCDRRARRGHAAVVGRHRVGDDTEAIAAAIAEADRRLGAGDPARLPRPHVRLARRRARPPHHRREPRDVLRDRGRGSRSRSTAASARRRAASSPESRG